MQVIVQNYLHTHRRNITYIIRPFEHLNKSSVVTTKNEKRVSVCLSREQLAQVEKMAIQMTSEEGKIVTDSEAIRRAIETCYPLNRQTHF